MGKYLDDIGIKPEQTPQGWNHNDKRQKQWEEDRKIYGFDERETWSLNYTLKLWLYERLSMYNEINGIDTSFHKIFYQNRVLTLQNCIDEMLEGLKLDLTIDDFKPEKKQHQEKINNVFPLLNLCLPYLWW